eukprot:339934_1
MSHETTLWTINPLIRKNKVNPIHIKCWNFYLQSNGQEPQTGTQFQRWVALSSFRHDIKYSEAFNIFDVYTGKGMIPLPDTSKNKRRIHQNQHKSSFANQSKAVHYQNHRSQQQHPHHHHAQTVATSRGISRSRAHTVHHKNHPHNPQQQTFNYCTRNRTQSVHHRHNQTAHNPISLNAINGTQSRSKSYDTRNRAQSNYHTSYNNTILSAARAQSYEHGADSSHRKCHKAKSDGLYLIKGKNRSQPPVDLTVGVQNKVFDQHKQKQNAFILQPVSCHIRAVSLDPKEADDIIPKDELTEFLIHYDIRDLKRKITDAKLQFKHLKTMEAEQLDELCDHLQLSIVDKMRFTYAVKDLLKHTNGAMYPISAPNINTQAPVDLMQSQSHVFSPPEALLSDDEYHNPYDMQSDKNMLPKCYQGSKSGSLHTIKRHKHGLKSSQAYAYPN